ncbi:MAG TPA: HAD family phosphatase [Candidatus Acidoferrum sp.]|nr:HAD family phosphatase [Candidatus Acidoferrum sp.]
MSAVVVFDLGKVLVDFDYSIAARKIAAHSRKSLAEVKGLIEQSRFVVDYETGRITRREFFERVQGATGFGGTLEEFSAFFADIFTEIPPMIELQARVRQQGFPTYVFSNTNDLAVEHIRRNFPFFANFDGYIYSFEVGTMKPDPEIYLAMEKLAGRQGADVIYLDDRPENVAGGAARGWRAILHETPEKTRARMEKLELLPLRA